MTQLSREARRPVKVTIKTLTAPAERLAAPRFAPLFSALLAMGAYCSV